MSPWCDATTGDGHWPSGWEGVNSLQTCDLEGVVCGILGERERCISGG